MSEEDGEENQFRAARLDKLTALRQLGVDPYPYGFTRTAEAREIEQRYAALPTGTTTEDVVAVAGRVRAIRNSGMFIDLHDISGKIQVFSHKDFLAAEQLAIVQAARPRRHHRRRGRGAAHAARRAHDQRRSASRCSPRRCCRCRRNFTASPISRRAIASAISTSS